jgi:hypothetical protein
MKSIMNMLNNSLRSLAGLFLVLLLFSACKKQDFSNGQVPPASGLMAFNLSPDQAAVGFDVASNRLTNSPLGYTNFTGVYLPIYPSNSEIRAFDFYSGSTLAFSSGNFADSGYYSTFLLGANGNYRNLIVEDKLAPLTATTGKAWVRYIDAIPDSVSNPVISATAGGDNTISDTTHYASVSDFVQVTAGQVNVSINNGSTISANRTITLDENKVYTLLFVGIPAATDSTKAVQIRFIQNGSVTQ